jgi:DNA polymerase-1
MVLQVHDEIIVQCADEYVDEVLPLVRDTMSGVKALDGTPILGSIPLIVSAKAGYTWAQAKGK